MQCILTRQDFDLYYHGERCTSDQPQSLTCPFCGDMGFAFPYINESSSSNNSTQSVDLFQHLQMKHADDQQSQEVVCPLCASMINGEPNLVTADLISHIANDHQHTPLTTPSSAGEGTNAYSRQSLSARDYDFGAGIRGGFRRGSSRTPGRRGVLGRGNGTVSQHFVVDTPSGLSTADGSSSGNDPIADLLTQLSTVRRLAAANNNSSLPPPPNTINLQTLTRQQYERERLRAAGRTHHHHHHQSHHSQQSTVASDIVSSVENDLFDSLFSSALFIDPSSSSTNSHQTWRHIVTQAQQQQPTPDQQSQTTSTTKTPTTNTESDPSLLRRMCDESSTTSPQQSATNVQLSKQKSDFVQSLLLSSFDYTVNDK